MTVAVIYGTAAGVGGLGLQAATAINSLATRGSVVCLGPGAHVSWSHRATNSKQIRWIDSPPQQSSWIDRFLVRRLMPGRLVYKHQTHIGRWAGEQLTVQQPSIVYTFTQVGFEALTWAREQGIPTILDNPNGHIRGFQKVYQSESERVGCGRYRGHPTNEMVKRVCEEYDLADRIRVSSVWAKQSMEAHGVDAAKISVIPQPIDIEHFKPVSNSKKADGPLQVCYVGTLDLRKGFVYLLRSIRRLGPSKIRLAIVGGTVDRCTKNLFAREAAGLNVIVAAGDPRPIYQSSDLFVLPSLEDGFGFVGAEAMACGLPVIVTDQCGAAEWVEEGKTGWVVQAGNEVAIENALMIALDQRNRLAEMGANARHEIELRHPTDSTRALADWVHC